MNALNWVTQINQGHIVYDSHMLSVLLPKNNEINFYNAISYTNDLYYLAHLLNEGHIKLTHVELAEIEEGFILPDEFINDYQKVYPPSMFVGYMLDQKIWLRYQAWEWLKKQGEQTPVFKRGQIDLTSKLLGTDLKVQNVRPLNVIKRLENGVNSFGYLISDTDMYLFTRTTLLDEFMKLQKEEKKQRKKLFSQNNKDDNKLFNSASDLIIPISNSEISYGDIVEWPQDSSTVLKGIVTEVIAPNQSANDVFQNYILKTQGTYFHNNDYNFKVDIDVVPYARILFTHNTSSRSEKFVYYVVSLEHVELIASFQGYMNEYIYQFIKKCGFELKIEFVDNQTDNYDAAIDPTNNDIIFINQNNMWNTVIHKYFHYDEHPAHSIAFILAHELGHLHPDSLSGFPDDFAERVDHSNKILNELRELDFRMFRAGKELTAIYTKWKVFKGNLSEFHSMELCAEYKAWQYGQQFIPNDLLKKFNESNLKIYEGYMRSQLKLTYEVEDIGNQIKNLMQ